MKHTFKHGRSWLIVLASLLIAAITGCSGGADNGAGVTTGAVGGSSSSSSNSSSSSSASTASISGIATPSSVAVVTATNAQ